MLGWIIAGLLVTAAVITIAVTYLNANVAKEKARNACNNNAVKLAVKSVVKSGNVATVKMDALDDYGNTVNEICFEADEVSSDIYAGKRIRI